MEELEEKAVGSDEVDQAGCGTDRVMASAGWSRALALR